MRRIPSQASRRWRYWRSSSTCCSAAGTTRSRKRPSPAPSLPRSPASSTATRSRSISTDGKRTSATSASTRPRASSRASRSSASAPRRATSTKELVEGETVRLVFDAERRDVYERLLAYVYVGDTFVNAELVRRGYATTLTIPPNDRYADMFARLEREASAAGSWSLGRVLAHQEGERLEHDDRDDDDREREGQQQHSEADVAALVNRLNAGGRASEWPRGGEAVRDDGDRGPSPVGGRPRTRRSSVSCADRTWVLDPPGRLSRRLVRITKVR